jgi:hypothetical protein
MGRVPPFVLSRELDMTWQAIFTWLSWAITLAMLAVAVRMAVKQRTAFYPIAVLAVAVGAFAEPMYDTAFDLWFYDVHHGKPGAMWSHFTAFGVVQPNWTHSGYVILYGAIALYAGRRLYEGRITKTGLFAIWGIEILSSCVFEIIAINRHMYTYYGPFELRILHYPLAVGVLEGTQTLLFTLLAVQVRRRVHSWVGLLTIFLVFPVTMMGVNLGLGMPMLISQHLSAGAFRSGLVTAMTLVVIASCAAVVNAAIRIVPAPFGTAEADGRTPARAPVVARVRSLATQP